MSSWRQTTVVPMTTRLIFIRTLINIRFDLVCMYKRKINLIQFQKIKMRLTGLEAHDVAIEA